jgi:hypothetical protein
MKIRAPEGRVMVPGHLSAAFSGGDPYASLCSLVVLQRCQHAVRDEPERKVRFFPS